MAAEDARLAGFIERLGFAVFTARKQGQRDEAGDQPLKSSFSYILIGLMLD